ncbi:MAG: DEAD/DEAH box helicase [Adlercreutzia sp.]|nr:DEAD/DEAH box helicase [Adlercreutzia sp.]
MSTANANANAMDGFSAWAQRWFAEAFGAPTAVQERAWKTIAAGDNALVIAPTGSGKTLAAFLWAIDRLMAEKAAAMAAGEKWAPGVRVLYVSPLKALGADVDRNLQGPLSALSALAAEEAAVVGGKAPEVRTAMRTGDTTPDERRKIVRNPPDILITTPESLYLMLTSQAREVLRSVETVIVDEVHALAGDKRGAHLSLSLERLDDLLEQPAQRVGLSATVRPREVVAQFLGGCHPVTVVAEEAPPSLDLSVRVPVRDMTAVPAFEGFAGAGDGTRVRGAGPRRAAVENAWKSDRALRAVMAAEEGKGPALHPDSRLGSSSIWPHIEAAILDEVLAHRSTIVFVNSRGLCEKLTARLNELYAKRLGLDAPHAEVAGYWAAAGSSGAPGEGDVGGAAVGQGAWSAEVRGVRTGADPLTAAPGVAFRSDIGSTTKLVTEPSVLIAKAHHGSVSKEKRLQVERELKSGDLPCVVATSSLELGIDMGAIDLVIQVAAPYSVASGLQRVGRANHQVGGRSVGIMYPRTRVEVIDAAVMAEGMEAGAIEATRLVENALDVLAQQTVAAVSMVPDGLAADAWLATVRRSACYADLPRRSFEGVLAMLAGRYGSGEIAEFAPRLLWDRETGLLKPRPGSQRLAVTAAGTIPDRGMFSVVLPEGDARQGRRRVGELDEEMVMESRVGDIIALGTSTWRIKEIGADRVIVEAAPGRAARLPFWHGEAVGRPYETGRARGAFVRALDAGVPSRGEEAEESLTPTLSERLQRDGLDASARNNLAALVGAQRSCTGAVPTDRTIVIEQCADETGDWRVVLHSPFGRRVHEPWALAVAHRINSTLGYDPQAVAADDGIVLRVPMGEEALPGADLFLFDPDELEALVRDRVGYTALFAARFRECAARALLMSPTAPGKRAPLWQQRLKGGQLLEAARQEEDFPIILEALRECLQDVFDLPALREVMTGLAAGSIKTVEAQTAVPSPFAAPLVFGYLGEHLYEGDLPHAERQASLLAVDPALLAELLGSGSVEEVLDPSVVVQVQAELQRTTPGWRVKGVEGVADLLRELGPLSVEEVAARLQPVDGPDAAASSAAADLASADDGSGASVALAEAESLLRTLEAEHRAFPADVAGCARWVAADDGPRLSAALGVKVPSWAEGPLKRRFPFDGLLARFARTRTPFATGEAAEGFGLGAALVQEALERLTAEGQLLRLGSDRWVDAGVLRRLRARSLAKAQEAVKPVAPAVFERFLLRRQEVASVEEGALRGVEGVAAVIAQFEGVYLPPAFWEAVVFPARMVDYRPAYLDELLSSAEVLWAARGADGQERASFEVAFFPTDSPLAPLPWDVALDLAEEGSAEPGAPDAADDSVLLRTAVRQVLATQGPLSFRTLVEAAQRRLGGPALLEREVADVLGALVREGIVASDSFAFPRAGGTAQLPVARSGGQTPPPSRRATSRRGRSLRSEMRRQARATVVARQGAAAAFDGALAGRWMLLAPAEASSTMQAVALVESLLDRYGIITRDIALQGGVPGGLSTLYPVLRAMEDAGELTRGHFVEGLGPAQFAARETVEVLRRMADEVESTAERGAVPLVVVAADDPACLYGAGLPWPPVVELGGESSEAGVTPDSLALTVRPSRREGSLVVLAGGAPVLWAAPRLKGLVTFTEDDAMLADAVGALKDRVLAALKREGTEASRRKIVVETCNGVDVLATPVAALLQRAGFARLPNGMRLYASPF